MSAAFTPGPWVASGLWDRTGLAPNTVVQDCQPGCAWKPDTAVICTLPHAPLNQANARLIAAAPDLYAALEGMASYFGKSHDGECCKTGQLVVAAKAALAKAMGE